LTGAPPISAATSPYQADFTSCSLSIAVPNPENGGQFDGIGQYVNPARVLANLQIGYRFSKRAQLNVALLNLVNRCFGGSQTAWSAAEPPGSSVCGYGVNPAAPYVSNFYNGSGPTDAYWNGGPLPTYIAHSYVASKFTQPFRFFVEYKIAL
jgi:hypothetical protein